MNLVEALEEIIIDDVWLYFDNIAKTLTIVEDDNVGVKGLKSVTIRGISEFYFGCKLDAGQFPFLNKLIRDGQLKKAVDAVLFCKVRRKNYIFLIEMESNDNKGVTLKFKSSRIFIDYLKSVFEHYYEDVSIEDFEIRSILFNKKVNKGKPVKVETPHDETFYHQGFANVSDNETRIEQFIK